MGYKTEQRILKVEIDKNMSKSLLFLIVTKMQINTILKFYLTIARMEKFSKTIPFSKCCQGSKKRRAHIHCRITRWGSHAGYEWREISQN